MDVDQLFIGKVVHTIIHFPTKIVIAEKYVMMFGINVWFCRGTLEISLDDTKTSRNSP